MAAPGWRWSLWLFLALQSPPVHLVLEDVTLPQDVLLFEHKWGCFFAILQLFCASQGVFWASMAIAAFACPPPQDWTCAPRSGTTAWPSVPWYLVLVFSLYSVRFSDAMGWKEATDPHHSCPLLA
ncbi:transmembrane protein 223 [Camelus ferus]|nr:transmembrane protein 223 [Camelus ferus]